MVRCTETLLMRLFRVFIRAQSEFLFRCYSDPHLGRRLVLAQPLIDHLAQQIVFGPGQKLDLGDQLGPYPMAFMDDS